MLKPAGYALALCLVGLPAAAAEISGRAAVIDGNTIVINGQTLRLAGSDAPESNQRCPFFAGTKWFCGRAAAAVLMLLAHERPTRCAIVAQPGGDAVYAAARCIVKDPDSGNDVDVGAEMIRRGMAWATADAPGDYRAAEVEAVAGKVGVFQTETERAGDYRKRRWREAAREAPDTCPIKGNIDALGRRIYHLPWSQWYALTKVSAGRGERWFCEESQAIAAGWRRAAWNFVPRLAANDMPAGGVLKNQR